jgi:hypothetical protein
VHLSILVLSAGVYNARKYYSPGYALGGSGVVPHGAVVQNCTTTGSANTTLCGVPLEGEDPFFYGICFVVCVSQLVFSGRWLLMSGCAGVLFFITVNGLCHTRKEEDRHYLGKTGR